MSLNRVELLGNLTRDIELRFTGAGKSVATGNIAVSRKFKDSKGEKRSQTLYIDVVAWGKLGEAFGTFCKKGREIFVEGYLELRQWEDQEGEKRRKHRVVANQILFLREPEKKEDAPKKEPDEDFSPLDEDDVPF